MKYTHSLTLFREISLDSNQKYMFRWQCTEVYILGICSVLHTLVWCLKNCSTTSYQFSIEAGFICVKIDTQSPTITPAAFQLFWQVLDNYSLISTRYMWVFWTSSGTYRQDTNTWGGDSHPVGYCFLVFPWNCISLFLTQLLNCKYPIYFP